MLAHTLLPEQTIDHESDGRQILRTKVSLPPEFRRWLKAWEPDLKVESPPSLRHALESFWRMLLKLMLK